MGKNRRIKGLTFIELMVVAAIFSLVAITVYTCLISGINVWRRSLNFNVAEKNEFFALEKMSQKLHNSLNYSRIGFEGEDDFFSFPYLEGEEILNITYSFDKGGRKLYEIRKDFEEFVDGEKGKSKLILSPVKEFKFSYRYFDVEEKKFAWKDEWKKEEGIPKWIKIEWSRDGKETKERIVSIPVS
jgi:prepilin-type N-terminal cleavage/methylation domain-containing protein